VARLSFLTWIGNAAAALLGRRGAVTHQASAAGCSRQTVYAHAPKVPNALASAHTPGPTREQLLADNRRLRDENRQLWVWLEQTIDCPPAQRRQFAVTAAALGLSLQQTLTLLAVLLPTALLPSRATLGRWVRQGAGRARRLLGVLDQACRHLVGCLCLDEIFFRRRPVLMGVEPHSWAWVLGQRAPDRSGPTWAQALAAWPQVRDVAADGGSGIALGLKLTAVARRRQAAAGGAAAPPLRVRLDVFHLRREGERALRLEWGQAEQVWQQAEAVERAKARVGRGGQDRRGFNRRLAHAWRKAAAALEQAERKDRAWRRAVAALGVFRTDGQVNDRAGAEAELRAAAAALTGARWAKVQRLLRDQRALTFLDRLQEDLAAAEPCPQRRAALVALWRWRRGHRAGAAAPAREAVAAVLQGLMIQRLGEQGEESSRRVGRVLGRVVRASSAVEGVNSVVRMHQARHRHLTQELLDLKRLYWNCRPFRVGRRRGRCPYEHLGLKLPTNDPWALLQRDPEELNQQLSTSGLAA
jgi:hypothetical protein